MCFKTTATALEQFRLLKGQKAMNSKSSLFEGCLLGGRKQKYHSANKSPSLHAEISVSVVDSTEGIKN